MSFESKPHLQIELDHRYEQASTDEELEKLVQEQEALDAQRDAILGHSVTELVAGPDGVIVDKKLVDQERENGHDLSGPYRNGRR